MTPGLPYGRGGYRGENAYQNQQESYSTRRELLPGEGGWVIRSSLNSSWSVGGHLSGHTADTLYLVRLPTFVDTFTLSEARIRVAVVAPFLPMAATNTLKCGIYVYSDKPRRSFNLIASSKVIFDIDTAGIIVRPLPNKPRIIAHKRYFLGTIINTAVVELLSTQSNQSTDEATISVATSDMLNNLPLDAAARTYPTQLPMPSYFSRNAAEVV